MSEKQFKPGQVWKNRAGELKTISGVAGSGTYPVKTVEGDVYTANGRFYEEGEHELDLETCVADVVGGEDVIELADAVSDLPQRKILVSDIKQADTLIQSVRTFTQGVGCSTDHFNVRQEALYTGLQIEELAEKLDAIFGKGNPVAEELHAFANDFKKGEWDHAIEAADREAMLDADVDLAWVTVGSMLSQGADVEGAIAEVARANMSKLVMCADCYGTKTVNRYDHENGTEYPISDCEACSGTGLVAIKDENGKVKKPEGWTAPNIGPFVCKAP